MSETSDKSPSYLDRLDDAVTRSHRGLIIILVVSFLLKLLYLLQSSSSLLVTVPIMDSEYYDRMAMEIASGKLIRDEAFFMGPLYPYLLGLVYAITGKSYFVVRILQIVGGTVSLWLLYRIGRHLFRPSVALLAVALVGMYGTMTFYEGQLLMMWLGTLINLAMILVLVRADDRSGLVRFAVAGGLLGLSALARANVLVFIPVVAFWLLAVARPYRARAKTVIFAAAAFAMLMPATIHNLVASGDFVLVTSNGGFNFYVGNSPDATGIFYPPRGINIVSDSSIHTYVERVLGRDLKPSEVSRYWYDEAFDFIRTQPWAALRLFLRKTALFISGYEVPQIESFDLARDQYPALRLLFVNYWIIISFAALGFVHTIKCWRRYFLLQGLVVAYAAAVILFFVAARYRAQVVPLMALFAAHGALVAVSSVWRRPKRNAVAIIVFAVVVFAAWPGHFALSKDDVRWRELTHEARRLAQVGRVEEAIETIDEAIEIHPDYADSYVHRAIIYKDAGNYFKAIDNYSKALEIDPNVASVHYDLGQVLRQLNMLGPAIESYQAAIALDPRMIEAYNNLGITFRKAKRYDEAVASFKKVLSLNPKYTKAYNNLGAAYAEMGKLDDAIAAFKSAIDADPTYAHSYKNLAISYIQSHRIRDAYDTLVAYLELEPDDEEARGILEKVRLALEGSPGGSPR